MKTKKTAVATATATPKNTDTNTGLAVVFNRAEIIAKLQAAATFPEKRQILKELSAQIKPLVEDGTFSTINEGVISLIYMQGTDTEFHSYNDWLKNGKQVKKGSKGFPIWARPKSELAKEKGEELGADEIDFHPVALLFSNNQVEPVKAN